MDPQFERILRDIREKAGVEISEEPSCAGQQPIPVRYGERETTLYVHGAEDGARLLSYLLSGIAAEADRAPAGDRVEELRTILRGEGGSLGTYRYLSRFHLEDAPCFAVELACDRLSEEIVSQIEGCIDGPWETALRMDGEHVAVIKRTDGEQTPFEFGEFLAQSLYEELGVRVSVGVGCEVASFHEIAAGFEQAETALRMARMFHSEPGVHSYREFLLVRLLEGVPKNHLKLYLEQFQVGNIDAVLGDEELIRPAEAFLDCSLNSSEASRALFMHRNTLANRLEKIARETGLDIRKFSDAVTFHVITVLKRLIGS